MASVYGHHRVSDWRDPPTPTQEKRMSPRNKDYIPGGVHFILKVELRRSPPTLFIKC